MSKHVLFSWGLSSYVLGILVIKFHFQSSIQPEPRLFGTVIDLPFSITQTPSLHRPCILSLSFNRFNMYAFVKSPCLSLKELGESTNSISLCNLEPMSTQKCQWVQAAPPPFSQHPTGGILGLRCSCMHCGAGFQQGASRSVHRPLFIKRAWYGLVGFMDGFGTKV